MRQLWPAPARDSGPLCGGDTTSNQQEYAAIPSADHPKLLVPRRPRRIAAAAVRNYKTAASAREQLKIQVLATAVRLGFGDLLSDRVTVHRGATADSRTDLPAHLADVLGQPIDVSLYIGPPRAVRKPVLQVLDRAGDTFAFAKLGTDRFTDGLVRTEARSAAALSAHSWSSLRVPTVLHSGEWHGHELLVQSALPRGHQPVPGDQRLARAMVELARADDAGTATVLGSAYWRRLVARIAGLQPDQFSDILQPAADTLRAAAGDTSLEFGSWHGDWAPWNMTVADDRILVWDWEKFEHDVPIGFDAVHYAVQGAVVLERRAPVDAFIDALRDASALLDGHGANRDEAHVIVWLYVLEIATRYLVDREMEAGATRMGHVGDWLAPVLAAAERCV